MASVTTAAMELTAQRPAAQAVDVVKVYGHGPTAVRALDGVTVDIPVGQFTSVMGPSGSGNRRCCIAGSAGQR